MRPTGSDNDRLPERRWPAYVLSWKVGVPLAALLMAGSGLMTYRDSYLWGVPDIGDPFDVEAFEAVEIPDDENAWTDYEAALALLVPMPPGLGPDVTAAVDGAWSDVKPPVRAWLADNQAALERWRAGTEKDACMRVPPNVRGEKRRKDNRWSDLKVIVALARLRAIQSEATEDPDMAWTWYRALLRYTAHGLMYEASLDWFDRDFQREAICRQIMKWAAEGRVTGEHLAIARDDLGAAMALIPPPSQS
jgi:hypothetical protein